jgi:hypothetical protein
MARKSELPRVAKELPDIEVQLNMLYPERSRVLVDGIDMGSTQLELRYGKISHNEVVIRIPRERVRLTFIGRGRKAKTYFDPPKEK